MADYSEKFADAVRRALGDRSYRKIAPKVGISPSHIGNMVNGQIPRRAVVLAFAEATGLGAAGTNHLLGAAGYAPLTEPGEGPSEHFIQYLAEQQGTNLAGTEERYALQHRLQEEAERRGITRRDLLRALILEAGVREADEPTVEALLSECERMPLPNKRDWVASHAKATGSAAGYEPVEETDPLRAVRQAVRAARAKPGELTYEPTGEGDVTRGRHGVIEGEEAEELQRLLGAIEAEWRREQGRE